ncbi:MAG: serine/threonine protein kinase [Deltaproteobacteria bacterium]|jgi:serine/threonine-protein kinase Stk1|nr:serine/threonine protein kinase [Deltaproteobacteria bacterium]
MKRGRKEKRRPSRRLKPDRPARTASRAGARFQLEGLLGVGGMCEVHAALDLRRLEWSDANPRVAVKRLLPDIAGNRQARLALVQEFFILRHLAHPGVVRAYDLHTEPWGVCYSMELLDGGSLREAGKALPEGLAREGTRVAAKLFETLSYLHGQGVVHADVKPGNIFLAANNRVVLIDFNASRVSSLPGSACSPVSQGLKAALRIPAYSLLHASPERLDTGLPSREDDVYSACCTVYELMERRRPFEGKSAAEARAGGLKPPRIQSLSPSRWEMLKRGLSFDPEKRPSAGELRGAFAKRGGFGRLLDALFR